MTLAVGSPFENGTFSVVNFGAGASDAVLYTKGCNANPPIATIENNCANNAGASYIFSMNNVNKWSKQSYVKAGNTPHQAEYFGNVLSLSTDGGMLIVRKVGSVNLY